MPMLALWFRFPAPVDEALFRARLRDEVGARRAHERNVDLAWHAGVLEIDTMDFVALAYAGKVAIAQGGTPLVGPRGEAIANYVPAAWTRVPWIAMPWWRRLRIWTGPSRAGDEAPPPGPSLRDRR